MQIPTNPKLYHIVHIYRLASIIAMGGVLSDAQMAAQTNTGSMIGMGRIKLSRNGDSKAQTQLPVLYDWLKSKSEAFYEVFSPKIKALNL